MKNIRKIVIGIAVWVIGLSAPGAASASTPVSSMAVATISIDDASDGIQCPDAISISDLSSLTVVSNQSFVICSGQYTGPITVLGVTNVKFTGKADPVKGPPRIIPPAAHLGPLVTISDSANVTFSGFVIDGADETGAIQFGSGSGTICGICVVRSNSVMISGNTIIRMRFSGSGPSQSGSGISVSGLGASGDLTVKILKNTIFDFKDRGIFVDNSADAFKITATITGNLITTTVRNGSSQAGILMSETRSGTISGNTINGDWGYRNAADSPIGIALYEIQNMKIASNHISGVLTGINAFVGHRVQDMVGNTISGNTVVDCKWGIEVIGTYDGTSTGPVLLSNNKLTGNKVTNHALMPDTYGVLFDLPAPTGTMSYSNNSLTGNTVLGYALGVATFSPNTDPAQFKVSGNKTGYPTPGQ